MAASVANLWMLPILAVVACGTDSRGPAPPPPSHLGTVTAEVRALFAELCGPKGEVAVRPAVVHGRPDIGAEKLACQTDEPLRPAATMTLEYEVRTGELLSAQLAYGSEAFARAYIERVLARALAPVHAARMLVLRAQAARAIPTSGYPDTNDFSFNEPSDILLEIRFDDRRGDVPFWAVSVTLSPPRVPQGGR